MSFWDDLDRGDREAIFVRGRMPSTHLTIAMRKTRLFESCCRIGVGMTGLALLTPTNSRTGSEGGMTGLALSCSPPTLQALSCMSSLDSMCLPLSCPCSTFEKPWLLHVHITLRCQYRPSTTFLFRSTTNPEMGKRGTFTSPPLRLS